MNQVMELRKVRKNFGLKSVLQETTTSFTKQETVAIIGPNGAGKSTLLDLMTANLDPSQGEIYFLGQHMRQESSHLRRQIGYLPQKLQLPPWATAWELLTYAMSLYHLEEKELIEKTLEHWDCMGFADKPVVTCSHGMQKRIGLALASIQNPPLLILDEPFAGLDILHTRALTELITKRKKSEQTTIVSCHITPYVAKLCERVLCIKSGVVEELKGYKTCGLAERIDLIESQF